MISIETQRVRANRNAWKLGLTKEIVNLEDNLDQVFQTVGLKPHRILKDDQDDFVVSDKEPKSHEVADFETIIDQQFSDIKQAANNICSLISSVTEFDLPIPVYVLLRLAARISSIRWADYKKKMTGSLARRYIYSKTIELINSGLVMFRCISTVLGTNIIPFQTYINQNVLNMLEWTRTSDLLRHDQTQFFVIRSQIMNNISDAVGQLSLNLNLEPKQLKTLIEIELVGSIDELIVMVNPAAITMMKTTSCEDDSASLKDKYVVSALICLEKLFIVYAEFLDAPMECRLKDYVIQTCIKIYRDFEKNVIGLVCRRQFLRLLETIANQPYATSATELAWHVFELAEMMETDPDIRYLARRSLKVGLAHRPIIVSHHDVYNCYGRPMTTASESEKVTSEVTERNMLKDKPEDGLDDRLESESEDRIEVGLEDRPEDGLGDMPTDGLEDRLGDKLDDRPENGSESRSEDKLEDRSEARPEDRFENRLGDKLVEMLEDEDDPEVQFCMSYFVDKPAQ